MRIRRVRLSWASSEWEASRTHFHATFAQPQKFGRANVDVTRD